MSSELSQILMAVAVFAGAVVAGFAGFAYSAVAGAILLHLLPPHEAVPLMMVSSLLLQAASLIWLRRRIEWRGSAWLIIGGLFGLPPALYVLRHAEVTWLRLAFGVFLSLYAFYMLVRPALRRFAHAANPVHDGLVGLAGGLIGGLTAMPGSAVTLWCDVRGLGKDRQRGLVQPYIAAMQAAALLFLALQDGLPAALAGQVVFSLPFLAVGGFVGLALFGRVNDGVFRRVLLSILLLSGLTYVC